MIHKPSQEADTLLTQSPFQANTPMPASASAHNKRYIFPGILWASAVSLLALIAYLTFFFQNDSNTLSIPGVVIWAPISSLALAFVLFRSDAQSNFSNTLYGSLAAFFCALSWASMALYLLDIWQLNKSSLQLVSIGILSLGLAFFPRKTVLLAATLPLACLYFFLCFKLSEPNFIEHLLNLVLLPSCFVVLLYSLRFLTMTAYANSSQNKDYAEKIRRINQTDDMTQVANRKGFDETLTNALNLSNRFHTPLSLLTVNIDHFQQYNDALGYQAGNTCLKQLADFLQNQAKRSVDTVTRTGGDEFSIILPGCDQHQAQMLAEKIQRGLSEQGIYNPGKEAKLTLSFGIACHQGDTPESLYRKATQALGQAKLKGENSTEVFCQLV